MDASSQALREALARVKSGEREFQPAGSSIEELLAFQPLAEALVAAEREGLVSVSSAPRSKRREPHYDKLLHVSVSGSLTPAGQARARQLSAGFLERMFLGFGRNWKEILTAIGVIVTLAGIITAL